MLFHHPSIRVNRLGEHLGDVEKLANAISSPSTDSDSIDWKYHGYDLVILDARQWKEHHLRNTMAANKNQKAGGLKQNRNLMRLKVGMILEICHL